ncbi:MAG: RagB/SusD family nutrient uptake outer membrane protein [Odoribacteraceae bacterium]|jgi:hypothetical protein|nr:RagB/SusD family nutrient uptake outer membrane protein [Odoribacteraceae bacterium]
MKYLLYIALLSLSLASCDKWLDVQPEASVSAEELFSREEGFFEAINGVYSRCADNMFYGGLFTVELQDALMQNYSYEPQDYTTYAKTAAFDLKDEMFKWRLATAWGAAYAAIVNCNLVLEHVDKRREIFREGMYELVKGEALALRAFLHFDILRLFSPSFKAGAGEPAIPYVTAYSNRVTPLSSVEAVMTRVAEDLTAAKALLANDPIRDAAYVVGYNTDGDTITEQDHPELFLQNRRHRLNYYAACGALARVYLCMERHADALREADEVIRANKFKWVNPALLLAEPGDKDYIMYPELVFAWYNEGNEVNLRDRYNNATVGYFIHTTHLKNIYETESVGGGDYRYNGWFKMSSSNEKYQIVKYARNTAEVGNKHFLVMPAIRLSEMYYIAAEAAFPTDPALAWEYLNTVRLHRNVVGASADFTGELLKEYRKETFAEGQAFYAYKRLDRSITSEAGLVHDPAGIYAFPLPDDEIEFGNR